MSCAAQSDLAVCFQASVVFVCQGKEQPVLFVCGPMMQVEYTDISVQPTTAKKSRESAGTHNISGTEGQVLHCNIVVPPAVVLEPREEQSR